MQKCPDCHAIVDDHAIFCDQCGLRLKAKPEPAASAPVPSTAQTALQEEQRPAGAPCPACGYINLPGEAFCANCGVQQAPRPASAPSLPAESFSPAMGELPPLEYGSKICPACGASNPAMEAFCQICGFGFAVQQQAYPPEQPPAATIAFAAPVAAAMPAAPAGPGPGRLLSTATNTSLPLLAQAEIVLGRLDPDRNIYPDIDLTDQGSASNSVSRRHARLLVQGNQVFVEDMNSTNSTYLNRQRLQPGQRLPLNDGDELRLGGVILIYYAE